MRHQHLHKSLMRIGTFAKRKKVVKTSVRNAITDGRIKPVLIGLEKVQFIDWDEYKSFEFGKISDSSPSKSKRK